MAAGSSLYAGHAYEKCGRLDCDQVPHPARACA